MKSPVSKKRASIASSRDAPIELNGNGLNESLKEMHMQHQQLQFEIGERDVEMERMKITLKDLNMKVVIVDDIREDCKDQRSYLAASEDKRNNLQAHLKELYGKIKVDANDHDVKHGDNL